MNKEPLWVSELLNQVCVDEGRSKRPKVSWGNSSYNTHSSGHYSPWKFRIRVTAGTTGEDHKQVFLHEICHWLTQPRGWRNRSKKRSWHGKRFYTKLNILLTRYDCLTTEYQEREGKYMKNSVLYLKV